MAAKPLKDIEALATKSLAAADTLRALEDAAEPFAGLSSWWLSLRGGQDTGPIVPITRGRYPRSFSEYEEWRKQQLGDAATRPHRITYGKLTR